MTYLFDDKISFDNSPNLDAFGRLRTSTPLTLFDSTQRFGKDNNFVESISGTGSCIYDSNSATTLLSVSTTSDTVILETKKVFAYQPGKSLFVLRTFCMSNNNNLIQRIGYFNTNDGIFLERNDTTINLVKRTSVSGVVDELRVPKSSWNVDRLDGSANSTNPSGITLDLSVVQIFFMDFEWLGVGTVRCGFVIEGNFIVVHKFHHANKQASANNNTQLPYMKTACLPLRNEVQSTGGSGSMRAICSSVLSEGGYELRGREKSAGVPLNSPKTLSATNTIFPIMAIRLKAGNLNGIAVPKSFFTFPIDSGTYQAFIITGNTSGGTWANTGSDSIVEYNLSPTGIFAGNTVKQITYFSATNQSSPTINSLDTFKYQLERDPFANTAVEFILAASTTTATSPNMVASINWEEIT